MLTELKLVRSIAIATCQSSVEAKADVNHPDSDNGWTPLIKAAHYGHCAAIQALLPGQTLEHIHQLWGWESIVLLDIERP